MISAAASRTTEVYPKIKEKNLVKVPESALNIFSWIFSHLPLVLFILAAIFIAIGIMQRARDRRK